MTYDIIYRNSDKRIMKASISGSTLAAGVNETKVTTIDGDIPGTILTSEWDTNSGQPIDRGKWFYLYVTSQSATIQADGISTTAIFIDKRKWDDSAMTDAADDEEITLTTTRGSLSQISGSLTNGSLVVTLRSVAETVEATVTASADTGEVDFGSTNVLFVP